MIGESGAVYPAGNHPPGGHSNYGVRNCIHTIEGYKNWRHGPQYFFITHLSDYSNKGILFNHVKMKSKILEVTKVQGDIPEHS